MTNYLSEFLDTVPRDRPTVFLKIEIIQNCKDFLTKGQSIWHGSEGSLCSPHRTRTFLRASLFDVGDGDETVSSGVWCACGGIRKGLSGVKGSCWESWTCGSRARGTRLESPSEYPSQCWKIPVEGDRVVGEIVCEYVVDMFPARAPIILLTYPYFSQVPTNPINKPTSPIDNNIRTQISLKPSSQSLFPSLSTLLIPKWANAHVLRCNNVRQPTTRLIRLLLPALWFFRGLCQCLVAKGVGNV